MTGVTTRQPSCRAPRRLGPPAIHVRSVLFALNSASGYLEKADRNRENAKMIEQDRAVSRDLLVAPPRVINVGLEIFALDLAGQDVQVAHVRWSPPAGGNSHLAGLLEKLQGR